MEPLFGTPFDFDGDGSADWIDDLLMLDSMQQEELQQKQDEQLQSFSLGFPPDAGHNGHG